MSYDGFIASIGIKPAGMTMERKDNNGNYELSNVRWASSAEQNRNQRKTLRLTFNGETKCSKEWERIAGLSSQVIRQRIKRGWTGKDLLLPVGVRTRWKGAVQP
jgi:hypothetical protein